MSIDLSQLISQLFRGMEHGQILAVSGPTNQTLQLNPDALSQIFQLANSNINQINLHINTNLGASAIVNVDHGAYPKIEAVDRASLNAKLTVVQESTVEVRRSTAELKESTIKLAEAIAKIFEWSTALNWPTLKLGLISMPELVTTWDLVVEQCISVTGLGQSFLEFGRSGVEHGESTVRDSDSILNTKVGESISLVVFDVLTSKLGEVAATFKKSRVRFKESSTRHRESILTMPDRVTPELDNLKNARVSDDFEESLFKEFMEFVTSFEEIHTGVLESTAAVSTSLVAFSEAMVTYAESLAAPDDVIAVFNHQISVSDVQ